MTLENMKQLECIFSKLIKWVSQDFQGNGHNVMVKGQNDPTMHSSQWQIDIPRKYEVVDIYNFRKMALTQFFMWRS